MIIGGGGHARSVVDTIDSLGAFEIVGLVSPNRDAKVKAYEVIACDDELCSIFESGVQMAALGIGYLGKGGNRQQLVTRLRQIGFSLPAIIDASAIVSEDALIEEGVFVGKGAIINSGARIRGSVIVNSGAIVEHGTIIEQFSHVAPGAVLCGDVRVGESSLIGARSVLIQGIHVGENVIVGAGSVVLRNLPSGGVWVGNPARELTRISCG